MSANCSLSDEADTSVEVRHLVPVDAAQPGDAHPEVERLAQTIVAVVQVCNRLIDNLFATFDLRP